jgi:hypothetical protein
MITWARITWVTLGLPLEWTGSGESTLSHFAPETLFNSKPTAVGLQYCWTVCDFRFSRRRVWGAYLPRHQGDLMMEAVSETSVYLNKTIRRFIQEGCHLLLSSVCGANSKKILLKLTSLLSDKLCLHIHEVPYSNLSPETGRPKWGFSC